MRLFVFVPLLVYLFQIRSVSSGFWPNFKRDVVVFWSGAGRFALNSLDDGLRTNPGTSAREFISFCEIANLPDLSVGNLTAPTAFSEESTLKPFCLVLHSPVVLSGLFPGGFDPSHLSFPEVCPAMVVCCISPGVHWQVSCTRGALVFTWPVSCFFVFWSRRASTMRLGGVVQVEMPCVPASLVRVFWNAMGVASGELLCVFHRYPMMGCLVQLLLFECLRLLVNECPLLFGTRFVRAMPTLSVTVVIACETAAFFVCTLKQDVPSVSVICLCPRSLLKSAWYFSVIHSFCILRMSASFFSLLSPLSVMLEVGN